MIFESLKEKCRYYQSLYDHRLLPNGYIICHLDGKNFSKKVKNKFKKPFDKDFIDMMNETAKYLCENIQGVEFAYVQSDEISLLICDNTLSDLTFGGRMCKIQSIFASMASTKFSRLALLHDLKNRANFYATEMDKLRKNIDIFTVDDAVKAIEKAPLYEFDCKVWNVPTENEVTAWFLFRHNDCVRNSKQQLAQTYCSHKELLKKQTDEQIAYLKEKTNIDWYNFSNGEKYGRYIVYKEIEKTREYNGEKIDYVRNKWTVTESSEEDWKNLKDYLEKK